MANKNLQPSPRNLPPTTYHLPPNRGFAMLFSVLISSLLVVIGLSIFNITLKELTISTSSRESQIAFYAANSGMECALYWNLKGNGSRSAFASSIDDPAEISSAQSVLAYCNGVKVNENPPVPIKGIPTTSKDDIKVNNTSDSCFSITVAKKVNSPDPGKMTTTIESQGKNICSGGRRVERGLRASITTEM